MLKHLSAEEIAQIVRIFKSAISNRANPAVVLGEIFAIQKLNVDLIINSKATEYDLVTALLMVLRDSELYELASDKPPLVTEVINKICANRPMLSLHDRGRRLSVDLGL